MDTSGHASTTTISTHFDTTDRGPSLQRSGDVTRFTEIDLTPDARFFVDFMDVVNALPDRQRLKGIIAERLRLSSGDRVLDVGCGTGDDVRMLAPLVGSDGYVIGSMPARRWSVLPEIGHEPDRCRSSSPLGMPLG
jgi:SAM-dependent methyltransferase